MKIDRFRVIVLSRIVLLIATVLAFLLILNIPYYTMLKIALGILLVYQVYSFIHFVEKTNREINRLLQSISYDDFTQTFTSQTMGKASDDLRKTLDHISRQFLNLRSEKEEHARYLQTVIKHIGVGLVSFTATGDVELLNSAAKRLLNVTHLQNIKSLEKSDKTLVDTLMSMQAGESALLKTGSGDDSISLSIHATQFIIKGELYTLVSLQDIQAEIEREHMAKELEIAWQVQESLLPATNPEVPGFDIAGMCKPAAEVGGDYYDFFPLGNGKIALVIGDVSGKGTSASFYMTLTKGFIQSQIAERPDPSPRDVLIKVNDLMIKTIDRRSFVTMFVAILDWEAKTIVCARAGHNPAIHFSGKTKTCTTIKPAGIALGLRQNQPFTDGIRDFQFQLEPNDWLILYTDGFNEALNDKSEQFGENSVIRAIKENTEKTAQQMVTAIYEKVKTFSHSREQHDDMTMVAIRCHK